MMEFVNGKDDNSNLGHRPLGRRGAGVSPGPNQLTSQVALLPFRHPLRRPLNGTMRIEEIPVVRDA